MRVTPRWSTWERLRVLTYDSSKRLHRPPVDQVTEVAAWRRKNVCAPAAAQDGRPKTKSLLDPVVMATQQLAGYGANRPLKSRHVPQASVFPRRLLRRRSREPPLECNANHSGRSRALHSRHLAGHSRAGGNYRTVAWVGRHVAQHMAQEQELESAMAAPGATQRSLQIQLLRLDVCF
jgi:hypothetical protein